MKTLLCAAAASAALAFGFASTSLADPPARTTPPTASGSSATSTTPKFAPWGFDLAGRDTTVAPGANFYDYANGTYVKNLTIPPDRSRYGNFDALQALSEDRVHTILDRAGANAGAGGEEGQIGAFYRAFMNEARANALGDRPLEPSLAAIRAANTRTAMSALMGKANYGFFRTVVGVDIEVDAKDPAHYAVFLGQDGLSLPDRDYYLEANFAAKKAKYQDYVAQILTLEHWPDAAAEAKAIVDLETKIAQVSWTLAQDRDPTKTYNPMTPAELAKAAPGIDWTAYLAAAGVGSATRVVVAENTAVPKIAAIFAATPIKDLQAWEAFSVGDQGAPFLSQPFVDANFEFRAKTLSGQLEQRPRWKRAVSNINRAMGEAVGKVYVAAYFPPESKAKMEQLVANIRAALTARIHNLTWMSDATKQRALQKLALLNVKIGYPSKWRDYSTLRISDTDLVGDVERSAAFEWNRRLRRLYQPVDKTEWGMTPQTVNAYYNPTRNEIVFPAAILQPPFFDPAADMAVNYGGIGGVIGHEMTHGFDDEGRHFDGTGALADWWTPEDDAKFVAQTTRLGAQYSAVEPIPGLHIKGDQTMGENIADLGGLLLGMDAYHMYLAGKPAPVLDGLTGDQRVFLGWAQVWRGAIRPDALRQQLVSDPHSPETARVNQVVRNIDSWYSAWDVKPTDPLYIAPDQRVRIW
ncbi:MAG TPA: M13-type metalloendopeptidase [Caulobacteraceae bacterium]|jgi:putative endopeptidase|nr:M13-type metalloendopeptidase [Caulobacteraceae bacterium]